jgi:hypothetical protein
MSFKRFLGVAGLAALSTAAATAGSFTITASYDSSINSDTNSAAIKAAIGTAITDFENTFTNPINVLIYFQEGGGLGQSNTVSFFQTDYQSFYDGLVTNNANPDAIAGLNANGGNGDTNGDVNPANGNSYISVKTANARAVGLDGPAYCTPVATTMGENYPTQCSVAPGANAVDGIISLNTAITNPGSPGAMGNYPLVSVIEHEIDEVLGLGSSIVNCNDATSSSCTAGSTYNTRGNATPEDLFRYNAGARAPLGTTCSNPDTMTVSPTAYFSYGPATGNIAQFNNDCNGGDFGDWQSGASAQVQDAFTGPGAGPTIGSSEIAALTAIGYTTSSTPEPGTMVLFGAGLAVVGLLRRRRA